MIPVIACIEEYDYRVDKSFIFDVKGQLDQTTGTITYFKDGERHFIRYEEDLNKLGCRIKLKGYEIVKE